jgi:hypothetical protein
MDISTECNSNRLSLGANHEQVSGRFVGFLGKNDVLQEGSALDLGA